jgi:hypothetical protein
MKGEIKITLISVKVGCNLHGLVQPSVVEMDVFGQGGEE